MQIIFVLRKKSLQRPNLDPIRNNASGTQLQALAWEHANPIVVEYISLMVTIPEYQQQLVHLNMRDRLSVADAAVLKHRLGLTKVVNFVTIVDPWRYPHYDAPGSLKVNSCVQSVVAQAVHTGKTLIKFTDASITDYLLSRLLVKKGDRPPHILKPREQQSTTTPRTRITAAATVMRKPCSPPVDVTTIKVIYS